MVKLKVAKNRSKVRMTGNILSLHRCLYVRHFLKPPKGKWEEKLIFAILPLMTMKDK